MKTRLAGKLLLVTMLLFATSCATVQGGDEIDARPYAAIGLFMPDDEDAEDLFGSSWICVTVGGIGPLEANDKLLGRLEVSYSFTSTTRGGFAYDWDTYVLRAGAVMMLDEKRADDEEGPYAGAGLALYMWSMYNEALDETYDDVDLGFCIMLGYRFPTEQETDWYVELVYDIVSASGDYSGDLGGISIMAGLVF